MVSHKARLSASAACEVSPAPDCDEVNPARFEIIGRNGLRTTAPQFDVTEMQVAEAKYRRELQAHPDSTAIRLNLAWCLFLQALYTSGRESAAQHHECRPDSCDEGCCSCTSDRDSQSILHECLRHAFMASNLSVRRRDYQDAARLRTLVRISLDLTMRRYMRRRSVWSVSQNCHGRSCMGRAVKRRITTSDFAQHTHPCRNDTRGWKG